MTEPTRNLELTTAQKEALEHYRRLSEKHGEPPTVRALASVLGKSPNTTHQLIQRLREKGYLTMKPVTFIRPTLTAKGKKAT